MTDSQLSRRRVLQLSGAAATVAVAGCLGGDDAAAGSYNRYVSAQNGEATAIYVDVAALSELDDDEDDEPDNGEGDIFDQDPLIGIPMAGIFSLFFMAGFSLETAGLGDLIDDDAVEEYDTEVDELLLAGETLVVTGDIETEEITDRIEQEADVEHEQTDEQSGFTIYESDGEEDDFGIEVDSTIAVSEDELLAAETRDQLDHVIETVEGDRTAAVDEFDGFDWLLSVIEDSEVALVGYVDDGTMEEDDEEFDDGEMLPADEVIDQATGFAGGLDITDDEITADAGLLFDTLDDDLESDIEAEFDTETAAVEFEFDDDRATISATFEEEELDE